MHPLQQRILRYLLKAGRPVRFVHNDEVLEIETITGTSETLVHLGKPPRSLEKEEVRDYILDKTIEYRKKGL